MLEEMNAEAEEQAAMDVLADVLAGDDATYSKAHIAKVWTLEPTALADARQALVNIRAGKELKDEFEGKTAADMEQVVLRLEEQYGAAAVELTGELQPEPQQAIEVGDELEQVKAELAQSKAKDEQAQATIALHVAKERESAEMIADLRAQLEAALAGVAAEGVPPVQQ